MFFFVLYVRMCHTCASVCRWAAGLESGSTSTLPSPEASIHPWEMRSTWLPSGTRRNITKPHKDEAASLQMTNQSQRVCFYSSSPDYTSNTLILNIMQVYLQNINFSNKNRSSGFLNSLFSLRSVRIFSTHEERLKSSVYFKYSIKFGVRLF